MDDIYKSRASTSRSASTLSYVVKTFTAFMFGEVQLPAHLSHYAAFFAGLACGAVASSKIHEYLNRNKCDRAKIQLAVYHIVRLFQRHPDYKAALHHPQQLLKWMEPEVLRMVGEHLTKDEAAEVTKELKRKYESPAPGDYARKRVRENERDVVQERMGPCKTAAYSQSPRGFVPEAGPSHVYGNERTQMYGLWPIRSGIEADIPLYAEEARSDTPVPPDHHVNPDLRTSDQTQPCLNIEQKNADLTGIHGTGSLVWNDFIATPSPLHAHQSSVPSPKSNPDSVGFGSALTPAPNGDCYEAEPDSRSVKELNVSNAPAARVPKMSAKAKGKRPEKKKPEGYGFDPNDSDNYTSSSSEGSPPLSPSPPPPPSSFDDPTPHWLKLKLQKPGDSSTAHLDDTAVPRTARASPAYPPSVLRMVNGVLSNGTLLSPVAEGGSVQDPSSLIRNDLSPELQIDIPASVNAIFAWNVTELTVEFSDEDETEIEPPASLVSATATPGSPATSATPVVRVPPPEEAQLALHGVETEAAPGPVTASPHRSPARSPRNSSTPKDGERCSPDATVRQLWPPEEQRSSSKKRKSPPPEQEQEYMQSPPSKRTRSSPLGDITAAHAAGSSERQTSSQRKSLSSSLAQQPLKRGRGRGRSSQPKVPETPKAKKAKDAKTPSTRKTTRTNVYDGVYTK